MSFLQSSIAAYGALALFLIVYFESFGAPLPGESALIASSLLALQGTLHIETVLIAVFVGAVLGDSTGYLIGRFGGRRLLLRYGHLVKLTPERLEQFEKHFDAKGIYVVATARFVVLLRQLNGIVAGSMKMNPLHFLAANVVGAVGWTLVWGLGPYMLSGVLAPYVAQLKALF
ncbi:membrane protein DedA with SNARE-associated domain [Ochrobactrum daejeonense]|uniref:Membrane protein DedA with SNARE-associated domain n=1 Tax=Brucella daejeonensis TaxID=659015 RepID=A0A7W9EMG3_9HYPH|nr:DedA family protein [Brucella daejeonensis]MBB5703362.1 membrane protein DedA with SNARE-associated domain [Brucella daejeonensis]